MLESCIGKSASIRELCYVLKACHFPNEMMKSVRMWPELEMEVKFAAAASNLADFYMHRKAFAT